MKTATFLMDKRVRDPAKVFQSPADVVDAQSLNHEHKLKILRHREFDCRELLVAEDENMIGGKPARLREVLQAMARLGAHSGDLADRE